MVEQQRCALCSVWLGCPDIGELWCNKAAACESAVCHWLNSCRQWGLLHALVIVLPTLS
jgi:hypothetical protein